MGKGPKIEEEMRSWPHSSSTASRRRCGFLAVDALFGGGCQQNLSPFNGHVPFRRCMLLFGVGFGFLAVHVTFWRWMWLLGGGCCFLAVDVAFWR